MSLKIIKFTAVWCPPCQFLKPILAKIMKDYPDVEFEEIDIDEDQKTTAAYKIMSVPILIFLKDGKQVDNMVGSYPEPLIRERIEKALK